MGDNNQPFINAWVFLGVLKKKKHLRNHLEQTAIQTPTRWRNSSSCHSISEKRQSGSPAPAKHGAWCLLISDDVLSMFDVQIPDTINQW